MKKKGLSLLEILVATILFALVISGLANIFVAAKRYTQHNRAFVTAAELSRYYLEPLNAQVQTSKYFLSGGNWEWNPDTLGAWTDVSSSTTFTPTYMPITAIDLGSNPFARDSEVYRIALRIQWNERTAQ